MFCIWQSFGAFCGGSENILNVFSQSHVSTNRVVAIILSIIDNDDGSEEVEAVALPGRFRG